MVHCVPYRRDLESRCGEEEKDLDNEGVVPSVPYRRTPKDLDNEDVVLQVPYRRDPQSRCGDKRSGQRDKSSDPDNETSQAAVDLDNEITAGSRQREKYLDVHSGGRHARVSADKGVDKVKETSSPPRSRAGST